MVLIAILLHLEETANMPIIHCFDWVSGTSTGAILALGLAAGRCYVIYLSKVVVFVYASFNLLILSPLKLCNK